VSDGHHQVHAGGPRPDLAEYYRLVDQRLGLPGNADQEGWPEGPMPEHRLERIIGPSPDTDLRTCGCGPWKRAGA